MQAAPAPAGPAARRRPAPPAARSARPLPAGPAGDDTPHHGQHEDQPGPGPGVAEHGQRRVAARRPLQRGLADPGEVAAAAEQQPRDQQRDRDRSAGRAAPDRQPAARPASAISSASTITTGSNRADGIRRGVGQRQRDARRDHPAGPLAAAPGPHHAPGRQRDQEHRHARHRWRTPPGAASGRARRTAPRRRTPPARPNSRRVGPPQQQRRPQHEHQRQQPGPGQPADAVGQRAQRRVDDRRAGEIRRERRDRRRRAASAPTPDARPTGTWPRPGTPYRPTPAAPTAPSARPARPAAAATPALARPGAGWGHPVCPGRPGSAALCRPAARPACCSACGEPDGENRSQPAGLSSIRAPASEHGPRVVPPRQPARTHPTYCHVRVSVCDLPPEQKYRIGTVLSGSGPMWRVY